MAHRFFDYEDGLYFLAVNSDKIEESKKQIKDYFKNSFKPAIDYLFSLGAPTPKILSNIQTIWIIVLKVRLNSLSPQFQNNLTLLIMKLWIKEEHPIVIGELNKNIRSFKIIGR